MIALPGIAFGGQAEVCIYPEKITLDDLFFIRQTRCPENGGSWTDQKMAFGTFRTSIAELTFSSSFNTPVPLPNQRIGYARVSPKDQLDLQRDALQQAGCHVIYEEAASGKNAVRPELEQCRKALRTGDTLVVWRLDRLGRSLPDLVQIVAALERSGIGFESLTEKIETGSAAGKLVFDVFAALVEFERNLIRERTYAGLAAARARGRSGGRKPKLNEKQVREIKALLRDPDIQVADVARRYGVSRTTLYKHVGAITPQEKPVSPH